MLRVSVLLCLFSLAPAGLQSQWDLSLQENAQGEVQLHNAPTATSLQHYIDSVQQRQQLPVAGYALDLTLSVNGDFLIQDRPQNRLYRISINSGGLALSAAIPNGPLGDEDGAWIASASDTIFYPIRSHSSMSYIESVPPGAELLIEDRFPFAESAPSLEILGMRPPDFLAKAADFGDADFCHVNARCESENSWPEAAKATVRIRWRSANLLGWCTGTLMNNGEYDFKPYILTAEHCALQANEIGRNVWSDWIFFFNYESPECENPDREGRLPQDNLAGADLIARSQDGGGEDGSDFLLLELRDSIPASFNPYFAGWYRGEQPLQTGLCYHHPAGDIKKVSTLLGGAELSSFRGNTEDTHWQVNWRATANGHGTTEGGSSGSSLLNENGLVVGTLTGGSSNCINTNRPDLYGTLAFSWTENGNSPDNQLRPWLDPNGEGFLSLPGANYGDEKPTISNAPRPSVYPNPVQDRRIELHEISDFSQNVRMELFDLQGRKVAQREDAPVPGQSFDLQLHSRFQPGLYILLFNQGDQIESYKLLIP